MSFGKSSQSQIPLLSPEQRAYQAAQTDFFLKTLKPVYEETVRGAKDLYNQNAPGALEASQNLGNIAGQTQKTLGETGESALRTGVTGLQTLFGPQYERSQIQAALAPAQAQYQTNVANLRNQFGGMGQLGSARQALAERQMAGATQGAQAQAAAQIQRDIAAQRLQAASGLSQLGQAGLGQALGAAGQRLQAAYGPQDLYNKYASVVYGAPAASYTNIGPFGSQTTGTNYGFKF